MKAKNKSLLQAGKKRTQPLFMPFMLATLTTDYFSSPEWIYEHKFDGQRCLVVKKKGAVNLMSRNRRNINAEYPELVQAFLQQTADNFIVDGEIVALHKGISDFQLLQSRINLKDSFGHAKRTPIVLYIFDVLYADGYDVRSLPLLERKTILSTLLAYNRLLLCTEYTVDHGITLFKKACSLKWEGVIAKKADSLYSDRRSRQWLKFKCIMKQELVIGGYTVPRGTRTDFGALLVGYYKDGQFYFAGKVGTGYSRETLRIVGKKLRALERKKTPFIDYDESWNGVHWVSPKLVAEFEFAQWTRQGKLRVGRYKGLRTDKNPEDVVREVPQHISVGVGDR